MSLYPPYFQLMAEKDESKFAIRHNCNGGVQFDCYEEVSPEMYRFFEMAIEEGKRRKAKEFRQCLGEQQ